MSFHERSAWACLLSTALIWGLYFGAIFIVSGPGMWVSLPALIAAIALQTIVLIVAHIAFRVGAQGDDTFDERDRTIARRSGHWAGIFLSVGVMLCVVLFPMREIASRMDPPGQLATGWLAGPFVTGNVLLLWFVLSEIVHFGAQVVLYRRH